MLTQLQALGYTWDTLPYPGRDANIKMAQSAGDVKKTWQNYPTYGQYVQLMQGFAAQHSNICRLVEIGNSQQGHKLYALKITNHPDVLEDEPKVFLTSTIHGNEPTGYIVLLRLANQILTGYNNDSRLTALVNSEELWINPLANPDGTYAGGDDTVKYATRVSSSGINLNRNFPDFTLGDHPDGNAWAPETIAMMNFATLHHFTLSANLHSGNEVVNYPWDGVADRHPEDAWFKALSRAYAKQAQQDGPNKYMTNLDNGITDGYDWFEVHGGRQDYMTYYQGGREVTIELIDKYLVNGSELDYCWNANNRALLGYAETALTGVRGIITDKKGKPLAATIGVTSIVAQGAPIVSDPIIGDYHRMLLPGEYTIQVAAPGYATVLKAVSVTGGAATRLDVQLGR